MYKIKENTVNHKSILVFSYRNSLYTHMEKNTKNLKGSISIFCKASHSEICRPLHIRLVLEAKPKMKSRKKKNCGMSVRWGLCTKSHNLLQYV